MIVGPDASVFFLLWWHQKIRPLELSYRAQAFQISCFFVSRALCVCLWDVVGRWIQGVDVGVIITLRSRAVYPACFMVVAVVL